MSLYKGYLNQLKTLYADIKDVYSQLNKKQSTLDKQISELYHELERQDLTHDAGYQYAIALQNLLRKRRIVKDELIRIRPIYQELRETIKLLDPQIKRVIKKSEEVRRTLNVSMSIHEVI